MWLTYDFCKLNTFLEFLCWILTDVNECEVYRLDQGGKLCVHECVNVPGSYHCACPSGYKLLPDRRNCEGEGQRHQKERRRVTDEMVRVWNGGAVDHMLTRRSQPQLQNLSQVWVFESFGLEVSQSRKLSILLLASLKWWRSRLVRNNLKNEQKQNNAVLSLEL